MRPLVAVPRPDHAPEDEGGEPRREARGARQQRLDELRGVEQLDRRSEGRSGGFVAALRRQLEELGPEPAGAEPLDQPPGPLERVAGAAGVAGRPSQSLVAHAGLRAGARQGTSSAWTRPPRTTYRTRPVQRVFGSSSFTSGVRTITPPGLAASAPGLPSTPSA